MKVTEFLADIGRPVAYYPSIAQAVGSVKAGIFISQIIYWHGKGDGDGWVYKSVEELTEETGLSYKEQRAARTSLAALGVLEEFYNREEHRLYFRLNADNLDELWAQFQSGEETSISPNGICPKVNRHLPKGKVPPAQRSDGICPKVSSYRNREYTETTTETTQRKKINKKNQHDEIALAIYAAYPRKVARETALKAIVSAIERIGTQPDAPPDIGNWLLRRTQLFAQSDKGKAGEFTPYPATWFNQGRYDDDETNWNLQGNQNGQSHHGQSEHKSVTNLKRSLIYG